MTTDEHPSLDDYLERARNTWPPDSPPPDAERLREIARTVGMTDDASEAADKRAEKKTRTAQQALDDGDVTRAEELLRDAILLSPIRLQPFYLLAQLYAERHGDDGRNEDRELALAFADRAHQLDPEHTPTRKLVDKLGEQPHASLPWKRAAMIVGVIVLVSGTMQLCHRYFVAPEVDEEQTEEVKEYLEEHGEPPR